MTSNFMDCEVHAKKYLFRCFEWDRFPPTETLCKNIGRLLVVIKLFDFLGLILLQNISRDIFLKLLADPRLYQKLQNISCEIDYMIIGMLLHIGIDPVLGTS